MHKRQGEWPLCRHSQCGNVWVPGGEHHVPAVGMFSESRLLHVNFSLFTFHSSLFTIHFSLFTFHYSLFTSEAKNLSSLPSDAANPFIQRTFAIFIPPFIPHISLTYLSLHLSRRYAYVILDKGVTGEIREGYVRDKKNLSRAETPIYKGISSDDGRDGDIFST